MYGLPGSLIQFGAKRAKKRPGRKSARAQFLEKQNDLFPVDLYTSKLIACHRHECGADLGAAGAGSAPHLGGAAENTRVQQVAIKVKRLYVPVTLKVSATDDSERVLGGPMRTKLVRKVIPETGTRTRKVSLTDETKDGNLDS